MTPQQIVEQGFGHHRAGRLAEAESRYAAALQLQPDFFPAVHLMGILRFHQQNFPEARHWLEKALAREAKSAETLIYYGQALTALGDDDAALAAFVRALTGVPPGHPLAALAHANRGEIFLGKDQYAEALAEFDASVAADPNRTAVWNNRGLALAGLKRLEEALASFDREIRLSPGSIQVHNNRGDVLRELRRFDEALASFGRALAIDPNDWATRTNRAVTFSALGRIDESLADYDRALAVRPNLAQALHARGNILWSHKNKLAPAIADLARLVATQPDFPFARGSLMRLKMAAADWEDFEAQKALLDEGVAAGKPVIEPFIHLALSDRPADLLRSASLYAATKFPAQTPLWRRGLRKPGRIRIGYVCGEFRTHPTLYLMAGLFEAHDRDQFEIFAFDNGGSDGGALRARFEAAVEHIVDISQMSDAAAAARIDAAGIDVAVDLNGYSGDQRLGVFAHRPAGVQVSYLAYPGSLGAPYMDYILADPVVIPPQDAPYYSEKIAWLPHSYQINDSKRAMTAAPSRSEAGLPPDAFVFCNFNHVNKFTPESFSRWMRIVAHVPASVLWLLKPDGLAVGNLRREAEKRGVAAERLIFASHLPFEQHLARLTLADLCLDGLPYGAHTTASDALWAGVPLVTCRGGSFAGRVATSLLTTLQLPELVTENTADFENLALKLATQPKMLAALREKLAQKRSSTPLFDTVATTRAIEQAYRKILHQGAPQSFEV